MFDRPRLYVSSRALADFFGTGSPTIHVRNEQAEKLFADIRDAGFECSLELDLFHVDDEQSGISIIGFDESVNVQKLRRLLRTWKT